MGGFLRPAGSGGGGGFTPEYALDFARIHGALVAGTEINTHVLGYGGATPTDSTVDYGTVSFQDSPIPAIRRVGRITNSSTTGPVAITEAGPTAPNADRSVELLFKLTANRSVNYAAVAMIGPRSSVECFGALRAEGGDPGLRGLDWQAGNGDQGGTTKITQLYDDTTDILNLWVYVLISYDASEGEYTLHWRAEGEESWGTATYALANAGTGSSELIRLGGDSGAFYAWPADYAYMAIHNAALGTTYRDGMWSLLGL